MLRWQNSHAISSEISAFGPFLSRTTGSEEPLKHSRNKMGATLLGKGSSKLTSKFEAL